MSSATALRPDDVVRRVGDTNQEALRYALSPDPSLSGLPHQVVEDLIADLPPVTAGALLGPAALARHLVASASSGRYRDLFTLWELFRQRPNECRAVLAERPQALAKARAAMTTAVRLCLRGHAELVAADVASAQGLIWQWLHEALLSELALVAQRPAVASQLLHREPDLELALPANPSSRWLTEAAGARAGLALAPAVDALLEAHVARLPATPVTLTMVQEYYPARVGEVLDRADLDAADIGAIMAWARDHGQRDRLVARVRERVHDTASRDAGEGLAIWDSWRRRGVELELPPALHVESIEAFDLTRPETAELAARLDANGVAIDAQRLIDELSLRNRQLAEKAYEAFVCADLPVTLPSTLVGNPIVRDGTRCPACSAWTWVRPGHERRCPRLARFEPADGDVAPVAVGPPSAEVEHGPQPAPANGPGAP